MLDNRLQLTVFYLFNDINHYLETKAGIRPAQFLEQRRNDIGNRVAELIDLRIEAKLDEPDWDNEEWSAMSEHRPLWFNLSYWLIQLIDAQIKETPRIGISE
ncbi:MAG TPA: hypothetical protein VGV59_08740 [Pyrinomonadaceae bacterium]|nr:hypothetical protein [Pyrinomonadaceae bacterium]